METTIGSKIPIIKLPTTALFASSPIAVNKYFQRISLTPQPLKKRGNAHTKEIIGEEYKISNFSKTSTLSDLKHNAVIIIDIELLRTAKKYMKIVCELKILDEMLITLFLNLL